MIYQLAKTSPLISGQVKMNFILNNNKVTDLQYVPISNNIEFNYNNPSDVLNYSHGENIKMLYEKISDVFYAPVTRPDISTKRLHRYSGLFDDTHDSTYEMGLKRIPCQRYKKQFEFFCPVWCDNKSDIENIRFELVFKNPNKDRVIYSKFIVFDEKIKQYLNSCYVDKEDINQDLIYIDLKKYSSYVKGINVETGNVQVCDTSTFINTLLEQERPVLEVDNLIANLFRSKKLIATQLYNFSFVFSIEDILPITMIKDFIFERINVYINVFVGTKKVQVKDFYSNYEQIPRYNINTGKYDASSNVLDYLQDYNCINLVDKNKLVQSTFHWSLRDNKDSIFNLYNGFAPIYWNSNYNGVAEPHISSRISCNEPDLYTDVFDPTKNPYGIFKYTDLSDFVTDNKSYLLCAENDDSYYRLFIDSNDEREYIKFGNIFINNSKIPNEIKNKIIDLAIVRINNTASIDTVVSSLGNYFDSITQQEDDPRLYPLNISQIPQNYESDVYTNNMVRWGIKKIKVGNYDGYKLMFFVSGYDNAVIRKFLFYNGIIDYSIGQPEEQQKVLYTFYNIINFIRTYLLCVEKQKEIVLGKSIEYSLASSPSISTTEKIYNSTEKPVTLYRYSSNLLPFFIDTNINNGNYWSQPFKNNVYWVKQYDRDVSMYLLDNPIKGSGSFGIQAYKNVYKMLNNVEYSSNTSGSDTVGITVVDPDNISSYIQTETKKFSPLYPSIDFFTLNSLPNEKNDGSYGVDYGNFYMNRWDELQGEDSDKKYHYEKEISWYKNNSLFCLPEEFYYEQIKEANYKYTNDDLLRILSKEIREKDAGKWALSKNVYNESIWETQYSLGTQEGWEIINYILNLYTVSYKTEYLSKTDISKQIVKIKFTLK